MRITKHLLDQVIPSLLGLNRPRLLLFLLIFGAAGASAQGFGTIVGTITDPTGARIPSASVTATQSQTGSATTVVSNDEGVFTFPSLAPTEYAISISLGGFRKYTQTGLVLQADQSATINVHLELGASTETMEVTANAAQVDTTTGTLSQVIDDKQVNDLPLNGRNAAALTTLVAGVVLAPSNGADQGVTKTFPAAVTVSANGSRSDQTNYLLNGGNNVDEYTNTNAPFPFPDALQEFSVQTSNYNAEYGQNAGAVVNIVTKSGTSRLHGSAFEYIRNRYFNAANYFSGIVDPLKRNQFGGTVGGPVKIPHVLSGQHTFFFLGYQGTRTRSQTGASAFIPTNANRRGDFSAYLTANANNPLGTPTIINDPATNQPFPGNIIPNYAARADPAIANFEKFLPSVDGNGAVNYQIPLKQDLNEYIARVDHNAGDHDRIFGHYYHNSFANAGALNPANLLVYTSRSNIVFDSALLSDSHTFTSHLLNNLIVNYSRENSTRGPADGSPNVGDFGVNIYQPPSKIINSINVAGFFSVSASPLAVFFRDNYTVADDVHLVKGNHNLAFGFHGEQSKFDVNNLTNLPGSFGFTSNRNPGTGLALASLQLGYLTTFTQGSGQFTNNRNHFYGFYAQDSWKATSRFTLNYGVRYEPFSPWNEKFHRIESFRPDAYLAGQTSTVYPNAPSGLFFERDAGVANHGARNVYTNIMPRIGFAYDVFGDGKTSLRGGGGTFYSSRQAGLFNTSSSVFAPFAYNVSITNPIGTFSTPYAGIESQNRFPISSPVPAGTPFPNPVQVAEFDPSGNFHVPVTYNWNFTVEQQVAGNLATRFAYVGSHTSHLVADLEINPARPGPAPIQTRRLYPVGVSNVVDADMGGNANYHSLQATAQLRASHGLRILANYTWSKALDTLPLITLGNSVNLNFSQSFVLPLYLPDYKRLDRGPSEFDRRHVFSGSYVYTLPELKAKSFVIRALANGWQTTGIVQVQSGSPLTILAGSDISQTGLNQDRAIYNGGAAYTTQGRCATAHCKVWLNAAAFSKAATTTFGNVQKGSFRGPNYVNWDAGAFRNFKFMDAATLVFRAEYFNLLNHTNTPNPITSLSNGGFGTTTSAGTYSPRVAQFSLKLQF